MLVLTRKLQEQIRVGDNIVITILKVKGNTVRVGIEAPRQVRVVRGELPAFDDGGAGEAETPPSDPAPVETAGVELEEAPLAAFRKRAARPAVVRESSLVLSGA